MTEQAIHPYCAAWPDLPPDELQALADNIYERGQDLPIFRYKKQIVDGKNRFKACQLAGVTPNFEEWRPSKPDDDEKTDQEIYDLALASNMRRHMTTGQRAMVAASLSKMRFGDNQHKTKEGVGIPTPSQGDTAKQFHVSRESVNTAAKVLANGSVSLVEAAKNGKVTPHDAAKITNLPKSEQNKAVKEVINGHSPTVAKAAATLEREPGDETEHNPNSPNATIDAQNSREMDRTINKLVGVVSTIMKTHGELNRAIDEKKNSCPPFRNRHAKFVALQRKLFELVEPVEAQVKLMAKSWNDTKGQVDPK